MGSRLNEALSAVSIEDIVHVARGVFGGRRGSFGMYAGCFACGAILGSAVALLYAPKSGTELRGDMVDKINEIKDTAATKISELKRQAKAEVTTTMPGEHHI